MTRTPEKRGAALRALSATAVLGALFACAEEPAPVERELTQLAGQTMGTTYSIRVVTTTPPTLAEKTEWLEGIDALLVAINDSMSTYLEESEISRLNRAPEGEPFPISDDLSVVLHEADGIHELSGGAFDVTVGPLVNALGFGPDTVDSAPAPEALAAALERTGTVLLVVDYDAQTVVKQRSDVYVDLSALAKGYAVDRVAALLEEKGLDDFMVEIGGEVRTEGLNLQNEPWRIGIERPEIAPSGDGPPWQRIVPLAGFAMATSGDYRNYREIDGEFWTHIVDPRRGRSVQHRLASVTVLDPSCMRADALATALMVLGPDEALALAEAEGIPALLLVRSRDGGAESFTETSSSAWTDLLTSIETGGADVSSNRPEDVS